MAKRNHAKTWIIGSSNLEHRFLSKCVHRINWHLSLHWWVLIKVKSLCQLPELGYRMKHDNLTVLSNNWRWHRGLKVPGQSVENNFSLHFDLLPPFFGPLFFVAPLPLLSSSLCQDSNLWSLSALRVLRSALTFLVSSSGLHTFWCAWTQSLSRHS